MQQGGLSVFLPWSVYGLLDEAAGGGVLRKSCTGAVLFCDVAGFTPLTEALSVLGREGAEELTRLLNGYFTRMIGILAEEGGDVLRFGGDAMTVFFPGESRERPARAALRMMEAMGEFTALPTRAGTFSLSMKVGAAHGPVHLGLVGSHADGWDYYAAGKPLDDAADAEHHAVPGRIVLHPSFSVDASGLESEGLGEGYARLMDLRGGVGLPLAPPEPPSEELLRSFVPSHLAARAGEGVTGEHRGTAVIFLSVAGLSWEDPQTAHGEVARLFSLLAGTARRYQGSLNKIDFGDKGAKAIVLFGAPFACERKEEMAARAALELLRSPEIPDGLSLKAGVTSAPLFSGPVGSPLRCEFTVMGDGINLAARLMAAAEPGRAFASKEVAEAAGGAIRFTALPPITVKGKRDPVPLFVPQGEAAESRRDHGLLLERDEAQAALREGLFGSEGRVVLIEAEPGMGKSALAVWALREARAREIQALLVPLAPFSAEREYSAFKAAVRVRIGAEKGDAPDRLRTLRNAALAGEDPGFGPLLNPFLDLPEETTPALRGLSPKERKELTCAVVRRLLDCGGEQVLLFDGLQWADPLSLDLLSFLTTEAAGAPWRMALFTRPGAGLPPGVLTSVAALALPPLSPPATSHLLEEAHLVAGLSEAGLAWFGAKARGNPAVVAALVRSLSEEGLLRQTPEGSLRLDEDRLSATAFPDTLEGLYLKQVDALVPAERLLLQEASVLGYSVSLPLLGIVSSAPAEARPTALASLAARGLLRDDSRGARPYMTFTETLLRDAVYAAIPYAVRRPVHLRLLETLLAQEGETSPRLWPTLAHHAAEGGDAGRARRFSRLSGREALRRFDNLSALRHLEFVCEALSPDAEDIGDAFALMDAYGVLGRAENATALLERLRPLGVGMGPAHRARLLFFEARALWQRQAWGDAESKLLEGLELYRSCGDTSGEGKSFVNLVGGVYGPTGQLDKAREALEKALALPRGPGQETWRATAAMNLAVVLWYAGRREEAAEAFSHAYREASLGALGPQKGMVADNLCALLGEMGRFEEAARWGRRATEVLGSFAVRGVLQNARYNLALAYLAAGRTSEVRVLLRAVVVAAAAQGNPSAEGRAHEGLAQAAALEGDVEAAITHARQALELFRTLGSSRDFRYTLVIVGNLLRSLALRDRWAQFLQKSDAMSFLKESAADAGTDTTLVRLEAWASGTAPGGSAADSVSAGESLSPEESLDRRLWVAEALGESGAHKALAEAMPGLWQALAAWPYFDARLRVLRLHLLAEGDLSPARRAEVLRLLSRSLGGIWGLRLLCLLWEREPSRARARTLRQRALWAIYSIHAHSPEWAWESVAALPEVRALLRGFRAKG